MVIADLYVAARRPRRGARGCDIRGALPGIGAVARFGERGPLAAGLARVARAVDRAHGARRRGAGVDRGRARRAPRAGGAGGALWIATPVHLRAGLTRVHLEHRGLLRLPPAEAAALAADYRTRLRRATALSLVALPCGDFLLSTAGGSRGGERRAGALRRRRGAGAARRGGGGAAAPPGRRDRDVAARSGAQRGAPPRGEPPVSALWPWGAQGRTRAAAGAHASGYARSIRPGRLARRTVASAGQRRAGAAAGICRKCSRAAQRGRWW